MSTGKKVDTGTERDPTWGRVLYDNANILVAQVKGVDVTLQELEIVAEESESLATERDTLRTRHAEAVKSLHAARIKLEDGDPQHAHAMVVEALAQLEGDGDE